MNKNIFIGSAWPYGNYFLHIGHLACMLPGDIIARFHRMKGNSVIFVSGTDCHGTPITIRAKVEGKSPEEISEFYHTEFVKTFNNMDFSYDLYSKTSNEEHKKMVQNYFVQLYENGFLYEKENPQDFCVTCNMFLSDREILGTCPHCNHEAKGDQCDSCLTALEPNELKDKKCAICKNETVIKNNKHLYFKLSQFQNLLEEYINANEKNWRTNAYNESQKYLKMGLIDRATTRQLDWGITVPIKNYEDKKIYVWIEAVLGYLTAGEQVAKKMGTTITEFLKESENLTTYFSHGKDNINFHTIIYPALLKALNPELQLPKVIVSSEYINQNDEKMSKSKGNLVTVNQLLEQFHKDTIRFYFIYNNPERKDSNFTYEELISHHNKFLVGTIGNFINRNVSYINKKFDGIFKEGQIDQDVLLETQNVFNDVNDLLERGEVKFALVKVVDYAMFANKFYDTKQPWVQAYEDVNAFYDTSYTCAYIIMNLSKLLTPFLPSTAEKIAKVFDQKISNVWEVVNIKGDLKVKNSELLFTRLDAPKT